jgi:hypothetical protein
MPGISLYSYLYLKLAKALCFTYYLLCILFNKIREHERGTVSARKCWGGQGVAQTMYTHVSKCKNDLRNTHFFQKWIHKHIMAFNILQNMDLHWTLLFFVMVQLITSIQFGHSLCS